jgi:excisionase family DNA binding protein
MSLEGKVSAREAADRLGYHINHLYRLLKQGAIEGDLIGRVWWIDESEVERVEAAQDEHGRYHHGKTGK